MAPQVRFIVPVPAENMLGQVFLCKNVPFKKERTRKMKNKTIKRITATVLMASMTLMLAACGQSANSTSGSKTDEAKETEVEPEVAGEEAVEPGTYKVAVVKQLDHASLDEIANAITAEFDAIAADKGITIEYEVYSGQNDQTTIKQITDQAVADGVNAIVPIATLAAQVSAVSAEESKTPVVFAAISDPESAELTGLDYVTGTSDALNTEFIMDMMFAENPDIDKVGLLYSLSETNSEKPIAEAKAYLDAKGIAYTEQTAASNDEVVQAASALIAEGVDTIFTPTDNVIMAAELAIYEDLAKAGVRHYAGADSFVRNGAFATCGVNYTDLGTKTADLAYEAMTEGMDALEDYYLMDGGIITVNTETAGTLNADYSVFSDMGELVEVETSEE